MRKLLLITACLSVAACLAWGVGVRPTEGQSASPERELLGIKLGRSFRDVLALYGPDYEIRTVAVPNATIGAPGAMPGMGPGMGMPGGDSGFDNGMMPGMPGMSGMPGMGMPGGMSGGPGMPGMGGPMAGGMMPGGMSGMPGMGGKMGGGGMFGPGFGGDSGFAGAGFGEAGMAMAGMGSGGPPVLPGLGGAMMPGGSMPSDPSAAGPEYSSAALYVYRRGNKGNVRLEFLMNEDGRVAQISIAAPAADVTTYVDARPGRGRRIPVRTARGITLGSSHASILTRYGFPEKIRRIPPDGRFVESYFTRDYHAAFSVDSLKSNKVVRITITLAD